MKGVSRVRTASGRPTLNPCLATETVPLGCPWDGSRLCLLCPTTSRSDRPSAGTRPARQEGDGLRRFGLAAVNLSQGGDGSSFGGGS